MKLKIKRIGPNNNQTKQDPDLSHLSASTASEPDSSFDEQLDWLIDQALVESFPASDPPCWTLGREPPARGASLQQTKQENEDSVENDSEP